MTRLIVAFLVFVPVCLSAQTVTFRSGEHPTFSRLVLSISPGVDWEFGRVRDGYGLTLEPAPDAFDLTRAFERIPRTRIRELRATDSGLILELACEPCHGDAFLFRSDRLVIDVIDGGAPQDSEFEATLAGFPSVPNTPASNLSSSAFLRASGPAGGNMQTIGLRPLSNTPQEPVTPPALDLEPGPTMIGATEPAPLSLPSRLDQAVETNREVSEMEGALIEGLARAASQGLLTPSAPLPIAPEPDSTAEPTSPEPMPTQGPVAPGLPGIAARTSIDRAAPRRAAEAVNDEGASCIDEALFDVASWADDRPMLEQLAERRANLTTETGGFDEDAVLALARLYIHFGFGLEALNVMEQASMSASQTDVLAVMAHLVDELPPRSQILSGQENCPSDVALWSALASENTLGGAEADPDSVIQTLRRLPDPLRGHLGQRLAQVFAGLGDTEAAEALLNVARGGLTADESSETIVEASIADRSGETDVAIRQLTSLTEEETYLTPETLKELLELTIAEGGPVPEDVIALAEVMRFEQGRNPGMVSDLLDLEIRAWIANDAFERAIALAEASDLLPAPVKMSHISAAVTGIGEGATDDEFLSFAFGTIPKVTAETENLIADRLINLGFHDRAEQILRAEPRQASARERRLLEARIALATNRANEVETILAGHDEEAAISLRVGALAAQGRYEAALALSETVGIGESPLLAWRAEAWPRLETTVEGPLGAVAEARLQIGNQGDDPLPPLAERRRLIETSADTRQLVLDLLGSFPVDPTSQRPIQ